MEVTFDEDSNSVRESHEAISGRRAFLAEETAMQRPCGENIRPKRPEWLECGEGGEVKQESSEVGGGVSVLGRPCGPL